MKHSILLLDSDPDFTQSLLEDPAVLRVPLRLLETTRSAQLVITDKSQAIAGIFVNPSATEDYGVSVVKSTLIHRPSVPVYFILESSVGNPIMSEKDMKKLGVRGFVTKPVTYQQLVDRVGILTLNFDPDMILEQAKKSREKSEAEGDEQDSMRLVEDSSFLSIRSLDFISGNQTLFDLYVKLNAGRYLKLLQAGDAFTSQRLENYLQKGVENFYIKKEMQEAYISYCDQMVATLLNAKRGSIDIKMSQTLNQGEETAKYIHDQGVNEMTLRYASKFISNVRTLIGHLKLDRQSHVKSFLENVAAYEHGVGTSMLAAILANSLEIKMERPVQIVGIASLLHDIGLSKMPEHLWHEDESLMSPEERTLYRTHPFVGAEILREAGDIDTAAVQAVEHHHIRLLGKGFPARKGTSGHNKVAEIVGISSEYQHLIQRAQNNPSLNILEELEKNVFPGFTRQVIYAFRSAFFGKSK